MGDAYEREQYDTHFLSTVSGAAQECSFKDQLADNLPTDKTTPF